MTTDTILDDSSTDETATDVSVESLDPLNSNVKMIHNIQRLAEKLPWYRAGGLRVTLNAMPLNIYVPILFLASQLPGNQFEQFQKILILCCATSVLTSRTIYCIVIVPSYMVSLWLCTHLNHGLFLLAISLSIAIFKVNICMSVCLHRYAAHDAFKCGPIMHYFLCLLGCLANQGGPLWWASQHRCHHKFCDVPRDPHSALLDGTEKAFGFFHHNMDVVEDCASPTLETQMTRIIDTWSWVIVALELFISYHFLGNEGLFCSFTSAWLCQVITCWFNIVNHPIDQDNVKCLASDGMHSFGLYRYLPFIVLGILYPVFGLFVMESEHEHHHDHPALAKRSPYDPAYWGFIKPMELMGLIWNVKV